MTLYYAIPFLPGGNLEWIIVVMAALMVFGARLPEVVLRGVAQVMRIRQAIAKMWRDTGLEDELRRVRRDIEMSIPREADFAVKPAAKKPSVEGASKAESNDARAAAERAREVAAKNDRVASSDSPDSASAPDSVDPDAHRRGEFELKPANDTVAHGDLYLDPPDLKPEPWARDQVPGADRQEPGTIEDEEPEVDAEPEGEPEPDFTGSHFGAGVQSAPKDPS